MSNWVSASIVPQLQARQVQTCSSRQFESQLLIQLKVTEVIFLRGLFVSRPTAHTRAEETDTLGANGRSHGLQEIKKHTTTWKNTVHPKSYR